jgi:hypothetical protein
VAQIRRAWLNRLISYIPSVITMFVFWECTCYSAASFCYLLLHLELEVNILVDVIEIVLNILSVLNDNLGSKYFLIFFFCKKDHRSINHQMLSKHQN